MIKRIPKPPGTRQQAWKLRLYPTLEQERMMVQFRGGSVTVYNWAIERYKAGWDAYVDAVAVLAEQGLPDAALRAAKKEAFATLMPNRFALSRTLTQVKKTEERAWWADVQAQTLGQALIDAERAVQRFLESRRDGQKREDFPRFRSAHRNESFRYQQDVKIKAVAHATPDGRAVTTTHVYLPKIGWVKFRDARVPEGRIVQATVKRDAGKWYCCVFTERVVAVEPVTPEAETAIGVLLGIDAIVTTHMGEQTLHPQFLERDIDRLARAQRDMARKQGGQKTGKPSSKNRIKALRRIQRIHDSIARKRRDLLNKLSRTLVDAGSAVITQDTDFSAEQASPLPKAKHRKMADASRGALRSKLAYKAQWAGKSFVIVEAREDSDDSQIALRSRAEALRAAGLAVLASNGGQMPVEGDE